MKEKVTLFDLRLDAPHKDVVLIRGNENESNPVPFSGKVKLSFNENVHLRSVKLALIGEVKIIFVQKDDAGQVTTQVFEQLCVLKVVWENLLTDDEGVVVVGSYGDPPAKCHKLNKKLEQVRGKPAAGARPGLGRAASESHLEEMSADSTIKIPGDGLDGTPFRSSAHSAHHSFLLPKGNYSLPFRVYLPANVSETVEGLSIAKLFYRLECKIKRGRFEKPLEKARHVRIVRTLQPNDLNLTDTVDIANAWPGKVDYRVLISKKGIAVGSTIPIRLVMVPLVKGLRLQKIKADIVEHYHCNYLDGVSPDFEAICGHQNLLPTAETSFTEDTWRLVCHFKVPSDLRDITQSCKLKYDLVEVKHRIRLTIYLKNPAGHTSELRANIPIHLYISANAGHAFGYQVDIDPVYHTFNPVKGSQVPLFRKDKKHSNTTTPITSPGLHAADHDDDDDDDLDLDREILCPPLYENSKFDQVYDLSSPKSPLEQLRNFNNEGYFDVPRTAAPSAPSGTSSAAGTPFDVNVLSRVPSYSAAVDDDEDSAEIAPAYEPDQLIANLTRAFSQPALEGSKSADNVRNFMGFKRR